MTVGLAVAALVLGVPAEQVVRCDELIPHLYFGVVQDGTQQRRVLAVGDGLGGRWPGAGLPLLRRWLDAVRPESLGAAWTPLNAGYLLEATGGRPAGFEQAEVHVESLHVVLVKQGTAVDPSAVVPPSPVPPPPVAGPPGAPGPGPVSRATLERREGSWRWRVETAWPAQPKSWQPVGSVNL